MSEKSTTPDLAELTRQAFDAADRCDVEAFIRLWAPDARWDLSNIGIGIFEGAAAIGGLLEDWIGAFEDYEIEPEEIRDLGSGVVFAAYREEGRPLGGEGRVRQWRGQVSLWTDGLIGRNTTYLDIDEARAAAERLVEARG